MRIYFQILCLFFSFLAFASEDAEILSIEGEERPFDLRWFEQSAVNSQAGSQSDEEFLELGLSAECEPLTTVAGCVNVISGYYFQIEQDLVGNGIEPIHFTRYYDSGNLSESTIGYGFGSQYPIWASDIERGASHRHHYGLISERENFFLLYRDKELGISKLCFIDPRVLKKGYTNLSRAAISGHSNFTNWRAFFRTRTKSPSGEWVVRLGDGTKRYYSNCVEINKEQRARMIFPTKKGYLLTKEIKPNGNRLKFSYQSIHGNYRLTQIESCNRNKTLLDKLSIRYEPNQCTLENLAGDHVTYRYEDKIRPYVKPFVFDIAQRKFLLGSDSSQKGSTQYEMTDFSWKVNKVTKTNGRQLHIAYYGTDKVQTLSQPLETSHPVKKFEFRYFPNHTDVIDANEQLTRYHIDHHKRIYIIGYFEGKTPIRQDHFVWSLKEGQEGWLSAKAIGVGDQIYYLKKFDYDSHGNIISETLCGNLAGDKPATFKLSQEKITDQSITTYDYNLDRNLLKSMTTPEGMSVSYEYIPKTNLCTKTLWKYDGKIQKRIFREFDDNGELKTHIEDDGSNEDPFVLVNITYRKIRRITAVIVASPAFGKPEKICEYYLDQNGQEVSLNETCISYDAKGNESQRSVTDSQTKLSVITSKTYDARGLLKSETNPLGHTTCYEYDENQNKIEEELIGSGKIIQYSYDFGNRLIKKSEIHQNGPTFETSYKYNSLDQLVEETDPYGNKTTYEYDRLGNQVKCTQPAIQDGNGGILQPSTTKVYNVLNQAIEETDENGHTTKYTYNVYGSPTHITYPDNSQECFSYYPSGWLKKKVSADGTTQSFSYDPKGHLLKETFYDAKGAELKWMRYSYKGDLLLSRQDSMGLLTLYEYDRAGRKIKETIGGTKTIHYHYDGLNRILKKEESGLVELIAYDDLNRPISKIQQNDKDHIFTKEEYVYDIQGNQIEKNVWQCPGKPASYSSHYNPDGSLQWKKDPLENLTSWKYTHENLNAIKQKVELRTMLDPLERTTKEIYDSSHRLAVHNIYDSNQIVSSAEFYYDAVGHLTKELSKVYSLGDRKFLREYSVLRTYNSRGLVETETEMPGDKKITYSYDSMKRLIKKVKPDGVELQYTYTALGKVATLKSSDGTISYTFKYDFHGNLIEAKDLVNGVNQSRHFDLLDRLEWEELRGIRLSYAYDALDRPTKMTLSDQSTIVYTYNPYLLKSLERFDSSGKSLYQIECEHDQQCNLIQSVSPAGTINYHYDLLGRAISIQSPHWEASLDSFDSAGNLLQKTLKDPSGKREECFAYNRLNHLQSEPAFGNQFGYDSLANCLSKNNQKRGINSLNQLTTVVDSILSYDLNGNLIRETKPSVIYTYDALNRLISKEQEGLKTTFLYDALGRCIQIQTPVETKKLFYQGETEIGSIVDNRINEFRLMHPEQDQTLALELDGKSYFPIQDAHHNICALQDEEGTLAQWNRYSAFGEQVTQGDIKLKNPWRYANKREVSNLILFKHRFYHPHLMRWLTPDPIGFEEGLNLYQYVHNNPFVYRDPDGLFVIPVVLTLLDVAFGCEVSAVILPFLIRTAMVAAVSYAGYKTGECINKNDQSERFEEEQNPETDEKKKKPPYCGQELGNDPTKCPGEGFEWKGKGGPETGKGNWVKNDGLPTQVSLHPDINHPPPKAPHWDYVGPDFPKGAELYLDGLWKPKE